MLNKALVSSTVLIKGIECIESTHEYVCLNRHKSP